MRNYEKSAWQTDKKELLIGSMYFFSQAWICSSKIFFNFAAGNRIDRWCNGSTTVFGAVCPGSNPGRSTTKAPQRRGFFLSGKGRKVRATQRSVIPTRSGTTSQPAPKSRHPDAKRNDLTACPKIPSSRREAEGPHSSPQGLIYPTRSFA